MTMPINFRSVALKELDEAVAWYNEQREGLGQDLLREVEGVLTRISEHPEAYPKAKREIRRALLPRRFPYSVFFKIESHQIVVLSVFHNHRDPQHWQNRK